MTDWKKKIDDEEEARHRREEEEEKARQKKALQEEAAKIQELGRRFRCHICGTPAKKPTPGYTEGRGEFEIRQVPTNWDSPT